MHLAGLAHHQRVDRSIEVNASFAAVHVPRLRGDRGADQIHQSPTLAVDRLTNASCAARCSSWLSTSCTLRQDGRRLPAIKSARLAKASQQQPLSNGPEIDSRYQMVSGTSTQSQAFDALVFEVTEKIASGETVGLDGLARDHPEHIEKLRQLLPTLEVMVKLGRISEEGCNFHRR